MDLGEILELILENNFLEFNETFYKEEIGIEQGSKCSPEIADIHIPSLIGENFCRPNSQTDYVSEI